MPASDLSDPGFTRPSGQGPGERRLNGIQTTGRAYRDLSAPVHPVGAQFDVPIPVSDGARLLCDVYRPRAEGRFPSLVAFSPYPRQIQNSGAPLGFVEAGASDFFAPRGYAHVIVNARGTCGSEGIYGLFDERERRDLYDVIEWTAAQPWCDGNVGMLGISYFGMAQLHAAAAAPPHLRAVFPLAAATDLYRHVSWHGGMLSQRFLGAWMAGLGILGGGSGRLWRSQPAQLASRLLRTDAVHRRFEGMNGEAAIATLGKVMRAHYDPHPWDDLYFAAVAEHPLYDDFWAERDATPRLSSVRIPVYLGAEWSNVPLHLPGLFTALDALQDATHVRAALMSRGGLSWPWESQHVEALAWYDRWLKQRDTGILEGPPIRYWLAGADEWRTAERWPPPGMRQEPLYLGTDGRLVGADAATRGEREYLFVPPGLERPPGASRPTLPSALAWETAPFSEPRDVVGPAVLVLDARTTAADVDWIVKLQLLGPDGEATDLTQGWLRASHRFLDEERSLPWRPWHPHDRVEPVPPRTDVRYVIGLVPTAQRVLPGYRLRLLVTSSDLERGVAMLGFVHLPLASPSRQTVRSSSRLLLPVIDAS